MFESVNVFWKRYQLYRWTNCISRNRKKAEVNARATNADSDEMEKVRNDHFFEHKVAEDSLHALVNNYYTKLTDRLLISIPKFDVGAEEWLESQQTPERYYLTLDALCDIRSSIYREPKERRDAWVVWLAALAGLVGAITGPAAILGS